MDELYSLLLDWTVDYVRNRDLLAKNIESIEKNKDSFDVIVISKAKKQYFIVMPFVENVNEITRRIDKKEHFSLIVFNTKENLDTIIDNWDVLTEFKNLSICFVNPFSSLDKKWVICPYTHHKISYKSSLELGLKTMSETVEKTDKKDLIKNVS